MEEKDRGLNGLYPSDWLETSHAETSMEHLTRVESVPAAGKLAVFQILNPAGREVGYGRIAVSDDLSGEALFDLLVSAIGSKSIESLTVCLAPRVITKLKAHLSVTRTSHDELASILLAIRTGNARIESVQVG